MGTQRIVGHQLSCDLMGELIIKTAANIDGGQFSKFECVIRGQLDPLPVKVGALGISL